MIGKTNAGGTKIVISEPVSTGNYSYYTGGAEVPNYYFIRGAMLEFEDLLYVFGFYASSGMSSDRYQMFDGSQWIQGYTLPSSFTSTLYSALVYNNNIHLFMNDMHYEKSGNYWSRVETLPEAGKVVVDNNVLYLIASSSSSNKVYKKEGNSWVQVTTNPTSKGIAAGDVGIGLKNEIHCAIRVETYNVVHYIFDIYNNTWSKVYSFGNASTNICPLIYDDELHFFNVYSSNWGPSHIVWRNSRWESLGKLPCGVYRGTAGVFKGNIHIIFKHDRYFYTQRYSELYYHYVITKISDDFYLPMPNTTSALGVVYDNEINLLGNSLVFENTSKSHYKFNKISNEWEQVSTLPHDYPSNAIVYNGEIHLLGFFDSSSNYIRHYRLSGGVWRSDKPLPESPTSMSSLRVIVYRNEIHLFYPGGSQNHYKFDKLEQEWELLDSTLPLDINHGANFVVCNDEIHALGSANESYSKSHYKLNKDTDTWEQVSTLPYALDFGKAICIEDTIHIMGSRANSYDSLKHYKFKDNKWERLEDLPFNYAYAPIVYVDKTLYILGGGSGNFVTTSATAETAPLWAKIVMK